MDAVSLVIEHGPYLAATVTDDDDVADMQSTVLDQQSDSNALAFIQRPFNGSPLSGTVGIGLQLSHLGDQKDVLQ